MFASYFGFTKMPFNGGPPCEHPFEHEGFRHALTVLRNGIVQGATVALLTGGRGSGKTTFLNALGGSLDKDGFTVCSLSASTDMGQLRSEVYQALGLTGHERSLQTTMDAEDQAGALVFLVDDAEALDDATLASLIEVVELSPMSRGSVQVVLAGGRALARRLSSADGGGESRKIDVQASLTPLDDGEVGAYIESKLAAVSTQPRSLFDEAAVREVARYSAGIPRRIDTLCGMALVIAYDTGRTQVDPAMLAEVMDDLEGEANESTGWNAAVSTPAPPGLPESDAHASTQDQADASQPGPSPWARLRGACGAGLGRSVSALRWARRRSSRRRSAARHRYPRPEPRDLEPMRLADYGRHDDWLGLKIGLVGLFAIAALALAVSVVYVGTQGDSSRTASVRAPVEPDPFALARELKDVRKALAAASTEEARLKELVSELETKVDEYEQQAIAREAALGRKPVPVNVELPSDVVLTLIGPDGKRLRIEPELMRERKIRRVSLVGSLDLTNIAPLLALAEPDDTPPADEPAGLGKPPAGGQAQATPGPGDGLETVSDAAPTGTGAGSSVRTPAPVAPVVADATAPVPDEPPNSVAQIETLLAREPPAAGETAATGQGLADVGTAADRGTGSGPRATGTDLDAPVAATLTAADPEVSTQTPSGLAAVEDRSSRLLANAQSQSQLQPSMPASVVDASTQREAVVSAAGGGDTTRESPSDTGSPDSASAASDGAASAPGEARPGAAEKAVSTATETPVGNREYRVVAGDTLTSIARRHQVTVAELQAWNGLTDSRLSIGQVLYLDDAAGADPATNASLLAAAFSGDRRAVARALNDGASIEARDDEGRTALMLASSAGHLSVVRLLLDRGAMPDARNSKLGSALGHAAWNGQQAVVSELVARGARLDVTNRQGWAPLMFAAINGHSQCVQRLLDAGAQANARSLDDRTALSAAVWNGHADVVRVLLDAGADVNARTGEGWTPLLDAAFNGDAALVSLLLDHGADATATSASGMTAAAIAAQHGHEDVVEAISKATSRSS